MITIHSLVAVIPYEANDHLTDLNQTANTPMTHRCLNVLLVEDDPGDALLLQTLLTQTESVRFDLVYATRLAEGLESLSKTAFDIMLLDLSLPDSVGLETIDKVRTYTLDVPIIVLTGLDDEEIAMQAVLAGAQDYLAKGDLNENMLARAIRYAVERHRLQTELACAQRQEEENLKQANDELEMRVEARTAELQEANAHLQDEIAERIKAEREREALVNHLMAANQSLEELTEEVQQSHREIEQLIAEIPSILIGVEADNRISQWNAKAENALALSRAGVLGCTLSDSPMRWDTQTVLEGVRRCRELQRAIELDNVNFTRADRTNGFLRLTISPFQLSSADDLGVLILGQDITDRRLLESQLAQAQKLEAIGQLAAGIAHEINTPTQYVSDNTRFLQEAFHDLATLMNQYEAVCQAAQHDALTDAHLSAVEALATDIDAPYLRDEIPLAIQQSLEGLERVATIVRAMKDFSHPGGEEKVSTDLNKAIESTITVARNEWKYVADMVVDFDPDLPDVPCLIGDINQVILNIMVNAAHAIGDLVQAGNLSKGTITVKTRRVDDAVEIRIKDTGGGIPEAIQNKIFDPFFTTKEVGRGTGQGLAIAHGVVVEKHHGTISFETEIGRGSTFIIRLPLHPPVPEAT
ncbi:hybrid sensor histidine kinase/response regulator [Candidatus Entotheonella palauensis]|uniref:hybrid sensor histidine kinase/response regulator n=1 Tax=Candidatus Entotheonella palauensis TaxID=93172 RepID=UPI000B7E20F7|nr:ATP-binding protein [Candidatus Entotheonella palauensis]